MTPSKPKVILANLDESTIFEVDACLGVATRDLTLVFFNQTLATNAQMPKVALKKNL